MQYQGKAWLSLALAVLAAAGCGKKEAKPAAGGEAEIPPIERISMEAIRLAETGNVDGAVAVLEKGFAEVSAPDERGRLFTLELSFYLSQNRLEDAQARYLKALASPAEAELAGRSLGFIEDYLTRQPEGHANVLAWCDKLEQAGLPDAMKVPVLQNRLRALLALAQYEQALALIDTRVWPLADAIATDLTSQYIQSAIAAGKLDEAGKGVDLVETRGDKRAGMPTLAAGSRIDLALARNDFAGARVLLFEKAALFDDGATAGILDRLARAALAGGKPAESDLLVEQALAAFKDRPATISRAARWWLVRARDDGKLGLGMDRLEKLDASGLPLDQLVEGVNTLSQMVLAPATPPADAARLMAYAGTLKGRATEEGDLAMLAGVQLDAGFRLEDYAGLVKVLEQGVPGHDKAWHATMINKVKAHLDLKEGRTDDAVAKFRLFMKEIETQEEQNHRDPITDERVTREMILGYNARRIGEIYAQAGRADDAAKAFAEAKAWYEKSLKAFAPTDPETKTVNAILAGLNKPAGG